MIRLGRALFVSDCASVHEQMHSQTQIELYLYLFVSECARESEYAKLHIPDTPVFNLQQDLTFCLACSDSFIETHAFITHARFEQVAQAQMLYGQTAAALFAKAAALQHEVGEIERQKDSVRVSVWEREEERAHTRAAELGAH